MAARLRAKDAAVGAVGKQQFQAVVRVGGDRDGVVQAFQHRHETFVGGRQGFADALGFGDVGHRRHPADLVAVGVQERRHIHARGKARAVAPLRFHFQAAAGRLARHQHVQRVLVLFVAAGHPIGEGRAAADQVGFVPADHAAERRVHVGDAAFHIQYAHAGGHGIFHGAAKTRFGDQRGFGGGAKAGIAPQHQQADDDDAGQSQHHPYQALLAHFLVDRHKHDAIVMNALQPEEHPHHTEV
ncbi:hypothetical protein D3C85_933910 [compost metagenome]